MISNNNFNTFIGTDTKSNKKVFLNNEDRIGHTLILGSDGSGKFYQSIVPLIKDDIENNYGVIVFDNKCELAEYAAAKSKHSNREFIYFNPIFEKCPKYNPLYGDETSAIEVLSGAFEQALSHLPKKLIQFNLIILSRAIKAIKRVYQNDATLVDLYNILYNPKDEGVKILHKLVDIDNTDDVIIKENKFICEWFISFYKGGIIEGIDTKKYSISLRQEIWSIINNKLLRNCLIPERGTEPDIIIEDVINNKIVLCVASNEGHLKKLSKTLSHFFMYRLKYILKKEELIKNSNMVYLNHAQYILNKDLVDIISLCKSLSIGLVISAHSPFECQQLIGYKLCSYIFKNCSTKIIYPYTNDEDYGDLIYSINEKDILLARYKARSAHYIVQNTISKQSSILLTNTPYFDKEYDQVDKIRVKQILENKLLTD